MKDGSVYVMSRFSQDYWQHGIDPVVESTDTPVRYSFTFRHVAPFYKNSTIIIGDSNTQHLKFGNHMGTFGRWTPGKRVKASKIDDIPPPHEIGPYRNIVIHTGINNITDDNRRSNRALITSLKDKCDNIQRVYPRAKLSISLLLPTKSTYLNSRVNEFNNLILDMTYNRKNVFIIDNSKIGCNSGCMPAKYGRHFGNGLANANDIVHLGKDGIRIFCMNIKDSLMSKWKNQSKERFRAGNGDYTRAVGRDRGQRG